MAQLLEQLRGLYRADPFRPFIVRFRDGHQWLVDSTHAFGISPAGLLMFGDELREERLSINEVESVTPLEIPEELTMTIEQLRTFLKSTPFQPFSIHLADGRQVVVEYPDAALVNEPGRTIAVINADKVIEVIDLLLVTSLRPIKQRITRQQRNDNAA